MNLLKLNLFDFFNKNKFLTDVAFSGGAIMGANGLNFIFTFGTRRFISDEEFAYFTTMWALLYLIIVLGVTLETAVTKIVGENLDGNMPNFLSDALKKFTLLTIIVISAFLILSFFFKELIGLDFTHIFFTGIIGGVFILIPLFKGFLLGSQHIKTANLIYFFENLLRLLLLFIFFQFSLSAYSTIFSTGLALFMSFITYIIFSLLTIKKKAYIDSEASLENHIFNIEMKSIIPVVTSLLLLNILITIDIAIAAPEAKSTYGVLALFGKILLFGAIIFLNVMIANVAKTKDFIQKRKYLIFTISAASGMSALLFVTLLLITPFVLEYILNQPNEFTTLQFIIYGSGLIFYSIALILVNYLLLLNKTVQIYILAVIATLYVIALMMIDRGSVTQLATVNLLANSFVVFSLGIAIITQVKRRLI